jgi:hypothetical protein
MIKKGSGFKVQGSRLRVHGSAFRVQGSGFRVQGSGFWVQEFWVLGSGFPFFCSLERTITWDLGICRYLC